MDGLNTELKKLVCSWEVSQKLALTGVHNSAVFHWQPNENLEQEPAIVFNPQGYLPAWTYEEIRIMIGIHYQAADLPMPRPNPMPGEQQRFYNYYPDHCTNHESGAEASAEYLLWLLETKLISAADVNHNYQEKFKPQ